MLFSGSKYENSRICSSPIGAFPSRTAFLFTCFTNVEGSYRHRSSSRRYKMTMQFQTVRSFGVLDQTHKSYSKILFQILSSKQLFRLQASSQTIFCNRMRFVG